MKALIYLNLVSVCCCFTAMAIAPNQLVTSWEFDAPGTTAGWNPNTHMKDVAVENGTLSFKTVEWDPFMVCTFDAFDAQASQFVMMRIKASAIGECQLFWSSNPGAKHGGFSEASSTRFTLDKAGEWQEIVVLPFWQDKGEIKSLRFDHYNGATFEIDWIKICGTVVNSLPNTSMYSANAPASWRLLTDKNMFVSPLQDLPLGERGFVSIRIKSSAKTSGTLMWSSSASTKGQSQVFEVEASESGKVYDIELNGDRTWKGNLKALALQFPDDVDLQLESVQISETPQAPADVRVDYFGFENGMNRAERECEVIAHFVNSGGQRSKALKGSLVLPDGLELTNGNKQFTVPALAYQDSSSISWTLRSASADTKKITLHFPGNTSTGDLSKELHFLVAREISSADYVPVPKPVETEIDVLAYYFPGWQADVKWVPVRHSAPIRKPLLGYYDENKVEVVDWQIKWAVENGITGFLVDWYWIAGNQHLTHWFEAYRKAKYRDDLQVAIMWANHFRPELHSAEDWRTVTQEWIDHYFTLPGYYRIDDKPAIFLWDQRVLREGLGGSEAVAASLQASQEMAKAAGYEGITFVAMGYNMAAENIATLEQEGYTCLTMYHEFGSSVQMAPVPNRALYSDVAKTSVNAWNNHENGSGNLDFYPVADTGWDARPWHGTKALAIEGRTPELFENILRDLKLWANDHDKQAVVLGPVNEWGEGSYIEPNTEFGFDMYETIRKVFAKGNEKEWPVNLAPEDVGMGAYEFPKEAKRDLWDFSDGLQGWAGAMGIGNLRAEDGAMRMTTASHDPAIIIGTQSLRASDYSKLIIKLSIDGINAPETEKIQVFWSVAGKNTREAASARARLKPGKQIQTCEINLAANPLWRGTITSLRLDPANTAGLDIRIEEIRLKK